MQGLGYDDDPQEQEDGDFLPKGFSAPATMVNKMPPPSSSRFMGGKGGEEMKEEQVASASASSSSSTIIHGNSHQSKKSNSNSKILHRSSTTDSSEQHPPRPRHHHQHHHHLHKRLAHLHQSSPSHHRLHLLRLRMGSSLQDFKEELAKPSLARLVADWDCPLTLPKEGLEALEGR